jgi:hypothetical protein
VGAGDGDEHRQRFAGRPAAEALGGAGRRPRGQRDRAQRRQQRQDAERVPAEAELHLVRGEPAGSGGQQHPAVGEGGPAGGEGDQRQHGRDGGVTGDQRAESGGEHHPHPRRPGEFDVGFEVTHRLFAGVAEHVHDPHPDIRAGPSG